MKRGELIKGSIIETYESYILIDKIEKWRPRKVKREKRDRVMLEGLGYLKETDKLVNILSCFCLNDDDEHTKSIDKIPSRNGFDFNWETGKFDIKIGEEK